MTPLNTMGGKNAGLFNVELRLTYLLMSFKEFNQERCYCLLVLEAV
jgi:hypothetical protein